MKKVGLGIGIVLIMMIIGGMITNYIDSGRVTTGHEPQWCIKIISDNGKKITYWGLGYKVIRYTNISPQEPYQDNKGVKMGNWFMKYELLKEKKIMIEYEGKTIEIKNQEEVSQIENIVVNSKYDAPICDGITTHKIIIEKEEYDLKEYCKEIQKGEKQAAISQEDLAIILKIINNNQEK